MKIKGVSVHITPIVWIVFIFMLAVFLSSFIVTKEGSYLYWGIPLCLLLLLFPLIMNYNLGSSYRKLLPEYEEAAKPTRIRNITLNMQGKPVRVAGVVQKITGKFLGRPRLTVFDGSASCIVFRSTLIDDPIRIGDSIEAVGMVVKKYVIAGALSVHGVGIWKRDTAEELQLDYNDDESGDSNRPKLKIKKYN